MSLPSAKVGVARLDCFAIEWRREEVEEAQQASIHVPPFEIVIQFEDKSMNVISRYEENRTYKHCKNSMS